MIDKILELSLRHRAFVLLATLALVVWWVARRWHEAGGKEVAGS